MKQKKNAPPQSVPLNVWTIPNVLSMIRLLLSIPLVVLLAAPYQNRWTIVIICLSAVATDIADGFIARHFRMESLFGRIIDPLADKVGIIVLVLGLILADLVPLWFAVVVVARDVVILAGGIHLRLRQGVLAQSSMAGKLTVMTVGTTLLVSLFGLDADRSLKLLLYFVSFGMMCWSLYAYGSAYRRALRAAPKRS